LAENYTDCHIGIDGYCRIGFCRYSNRKNPDVPTAIDCCCADRRPSQTEINPTGLPAAINPTIATTDWQTYTNTQYHYSLKYPLGWLARSPGPGGLQPLNTGSKSIILSSNNQEVTVPNPLFEIQAEGPETLSRPAYSEWEKQTKTKFSEDYKLTQESTSAISGITATVLEGEHLYPEGSTYVKQFIFASSEKDVYFKITIAGNTKQASSVFDQILPTFRFDN